MRLQPTLPCVHLCTGGEQNGVSKYRDKSDKENVYPSRSTRIGVAVSGGMVACQTRSTSWWHGEEPESLDAVVVLCIHVRLLHDAACCCVLLRVAACCCVVLRGAACGDVQVMNAHDYIVFVYVMNGE